MSPTPITCVKCIGGHHQCIGDIISALRDIISVFRSVQYIWEDVTSALVRNHDLCWDIIGAMGVLSALGDTISALEEGGVMICVGVIISPFGVFHNHTDIPLMKCLPPPPPPPNALTMSHPKH